jgi:hypothetical protein
VLVCVQIAFELCADRVPRRRFPAPMIAAATVTINAFTSNSQNQGGWFE